jgi:ribonuclease Z
LVFSGDTQPCETLTAACAGADLVIHEATFADGLEAEARAKRHSTVGEAVAAAATARALLLNHFSQRYPKLPSFVAERGAAAIAANAGTGGDGGAAVVAPPSDAPIGRPRVGIAFDLMRVVSVRRDMAALEAATPSYQALLEEYERWGDGTSKRLRTGGAAAGADAKPPQQPAAEA